ncbi:ABC transporter ATP-binding protein [Klebsiella michiganensis]|nr:ABC transporter ATP-binding protein [Klebsiella michiganensis]
MNVLSVEHLRISYRSQREWREVVHDVSFQVKPRRNAGVCR